MTFISIVTPCYNELENVEELYRQIKAIMAEVADIEYEHIYIDNASNDGTVAVLRRLAKEDKRVKVILNTRNFGPVRSPYYALLQCTSEATIILSSDLQDPPSLIPQFIEKWKEGYKVVMGVKTESEESPIVYALRTLYYWALRAFSEVDLVAHATGFGLYDQVVIQKLRTLQDSYPYFRGLIAELGYECTTIAYKQPKRVSGVSKADFYTLYNLAMLGLTSHSRLPLRLAGMIGFFSSLISFIIGMVYLIYKLVDWQNFSLGLAPVTVGLFFFASVQLIFLGVIGEYIGAIYTQVLKRPLVVEQERINF
jgi:glycosyltransferase involved in cell wall biosynthesis